MPDLLKHAELAFDECRGELAIMIGEKAADHILGKEQLAASNAAYHSAPNRQTTQS